MGLEPTASALRERYSTRRLSGQFPRRFVIVLCLLEITHQSTVVLSGSKFDLLSMISLTSCFQCSNQVISQRSGFDLTQRASAVVTQMK